MTPGANAANGSERRWTINGDFVALKPTGVHRYAREVTLALDALAGEGHPLTDRLNLEIVAPRGAPGLPLAHIPLRIVREYAKPRLPQVWAQLQLPRHAPGGLLSFCNLAPVAVKRHIVCIHDLHTLIRPESYGRGFRLAHRVILPMLGRSAAAVTTVSGLSREHLIAHRIAPPGKITVTYNGADHAARWDPSAATIIPGQRPFVVCICRNQPYKNMQMILAIAPALDAMGLDVYLAGSDAPDVRGSFGEEQPPNIRLLGRIGDDDLAWAFQNALCFLFPSRIEGFGLPAVEAMMWGCPVIAADAPCLPEVCGEAALYAGPDDCEGWIEAVRRLRDDTGLRRGLIGKGCARARRYSWRRIAEIYLELMAKLDRLEP